MPGTWPKLYNYFSIIGVWMLKVTQKKNAVKCTGKNSESPKRRRESLASEGTVGSLRKVVARLGAGLARESFCV
jgi:hypothetical protein